MSNSAMHHLDTLPPLRIFLAHAHEDKPSVRELSQRLKADGLHVWFDEEALLPGHDWESKIKEAVRKSDIIIICLSHRSIAKTGYFNTEIKLALDEADRKPEDAIFIIPAKLEECGVPKRLDKWHWVDLFRPDGYGRLLKALQDRATSLFDRYESITPSPDQALERLKDGNRRFVIGQVKHPNQSAWDRSRVAKGDPHPYAAILSCSDSDVPPEIIFDAGLGDLHIVRVIGNVIKDGELLDSIVYAVEDLHVPVVMVLGHANCEIVKKATRIIELDSQVGGVIGSLLPAVQDARSLPGDIVRNTVKANIRRALEKLEHSKFLDTMIRDGKLIIVGACYDHGSGVVELLN